MYAKIVYTEYTFPEFIFRDTKTRPDRMKIQTNIAEALKCQRTAQLYTGNSLKNKIYRKGHAFYLMVGTTPKKSKISEKRYFGADCEVYVVVVYVGIF